MKIYEIGTGYTPIPAKMGAATEIVVEELTKALIKSDMDVAILDMNAKHRSNNSLPIIEVKIPFLLMKTDVQLGILHKMKRIIYSISLAIKLKSLISDDSTKTILHFHNQYNLYFFLKLVPKRKYRHCIIAYTNHSYIWHGEWSSIKEKINKRYFQEIACMKNADQVYVLNNNTENILINHLEIAKEKIQLIDNGVNIQIYRPLTKNQVNTLKEDMEIAAKRIFLQVGSVCDRKNQLGALQLLLPLLKEDTNLLYMFIGGIIDKNYYQKVSAYALENGIENQIRYLGEIEPGNELNKYYNLADAIVFPSKSEGFSLVIIEALSAGIPVIIDDSLQFKLADKCLRYRNSKDFEDKVRENIFLDDKREALSVEVREFIVRHYGWEKIAQDYYKSWSNLASV